MLSLKVFIGTGILVGTDQETLQMLLTHINLNKMNEKLRSGVLQFIGCVIGLLLGNWLFNKGCNSSSHKPHADTTITIHKGKSDTVIKITK